MSEEKMIDLYGEKRDGKHGSYWITKEDADKFDTLCKEINVSKAEGFNALIKAFELSKAREAVPDAKAVIKHFDELVAQISACFLESVYLYKSADEKADEKYTDLIREQEKEINTLKAEIEKLEGLREEAETARAEADKAQIDVAQQKIINKLLTDKLAGYDEMKARTEKLTDDLAKATDQIRQNEIDQERAVMEKEREMTTKMLDLITENAELKAQLK